MPNFDIELQSICAKYGLHLESREHYAEKFLETFCEIWEQIPDDEPIAFYGCAQGFYHMCKKVELGSKNIVCIVENKLNISTFDICGADKIPVVSIKNISRYKFNKIILTGFTVRREMRRDISAYDAGIEIIDIYDILEKKGHGYDKNFFYKTGLHWTIMEPALLAYKNSINPDEEQKNLKKLIQSYLERRDFVYADIYIEKYISYSYSDSDVFAHLKTEIQQFLMKIKEIIKKRENKSVFVFVVDALSYETSKAAPFIRRFGQDGLVFSNAYASGVNTRTTTYGFLTGKMYVENGLYKIAFLGKEDSNFLLEMKTLGVKVKHISTPYFTFIENANDYNGFRAHVQPLLNWDMLMEIIHDPSDCIYFIHNSELHQPFFSGDPSEPFIATAEELYKNVTAPDKASPGFFERGKKLRQDALKYVDKQIEFCISFLNLDKDDIIITADHGSYTPFLEAAGMPVTRDESKIALIIHSKSVNAGSYEDIYSTSEMPELLRQLIRGDRELKITALEYARQEVDPAYGKDLIRNPHGDYIYGYTLFTTNTEQYIIYFNGLEGYFLFPDFETNLIEDERYKERIDYFRSQIHIDTREVWRFMFDRHPHLLEVHKDRVDVFLNENILFRSKKGL